MKTIKALIPIYDKQVADQFDWKKIKETAIANAHEEHGKKHRQHLVCAQQHQAQSTRPSHFYHEAGGSQGTISDEQRYGWREGGLSIFWKCCQFF